MVDMEQVKTLLGQIDLATTREELKTLTLKVYKEVDDGFQQMVFGVFIALKDHDIRLKDIESKLSRGEGLT